jgi:hypothetical protein
MTEAAKHTPGPWRWEINRKHKSINLCGGLPAGTFDKTVLGFECYGMGGAAPVFHNWTAGGWGGAPKRCYELAVEQVGREHHAGWFALIDHPNAHLIAAAPELLDSLLDFIFVYGMNNAEPEELRVSLGNIIGKAKDAARKAIGRAA